MKLLIVTQVVDENDPILGFFCRWLSEFAKHFERIEVICLKEGEHALPTNVHVHSLGKPASRLWYAAKFGYLIWTLRTKYDQVFVHMNPEYVILARPDWWLMGKKVAFWYNHPNNDWRLRLAAFLSNKIFYTSPYSATAKMPHAVRMPAGIDTELFKPQSVVRNRHALYMQGRIMTSKHVETALAALRLVRKEISDVTLTLVGPEDKEYVEKLRKDFADVIGSVTFMGSKPNVETPSLYSAHGISINLADDGHYDKSVLESIACGTPVALSSHAFSENGVAIAPNLFIIRERSPRALSEMINLILMEHTRLEGLAGRGRSVVIERESLDALVHKLVRELST